MFEIASKIIFCLLLAALLGFVIGYFFAKIQKCKEKENGEDKKADIQEDGIGGIKPETFSKEAVEPDDLKKIKGIGEKIETSLNELGIYTFKQISLWEEAEVKWVDTYLTFKGRIEREEWISQAKILASGKETDFSKKYK